MGPSAAGVCPALLLLVAPLSELRPHLLCEAGLQRVGSEKGFVDKVGVGYCRELRDSRISLGGFAIDPNGEFEGTVILFS